MAALIFERAGAPDLSPPLQPHTLTTWSFTRGPFGGEAAAGRRAWPWSNQSSCFSELWFTIFYAGELRQQGPDAHPWLYVIQFLFVNKARFVAGLLLKVVIKVTDSNMLAQLVKIDVFFFFAFFFSPTPLGKEKRKKKRFTAVTCECCGSMWWIRASRPQPGELVPTDGVGLQPCGDDGEGRKNDGRGSVERFKPEADSEGRNDIRISQNNKRLARLAGTMWAAVMEV